MLELCFYEQINLIYMMPFFSLNYLTNRTLTKFDTRLHFLKTITNHGLQVNLAFNSKIFLILLSMMEMEGPEDLLFRMRDS